MPKREGMMTQQPRGGRFTVNLAVGALMACAGTSRGATPTRNMLQMDVRGQAVEGSPLTWSTQNVALLARDGRVWEFRPDEARNARDTGAAFRGYSTSELRARLTKEFGNAFDVTGTGHYVVVHPRGQRDYWAGRFEELYRSFVHYFTVRGFRPSEPGFPLVAIVFKTQADLMRYARQEGTNISPTTLGYYSPRTNRVALYDAGGGAASDADWQANAAVIIHEATHQTAFNTGLHRRLASVPRWLAEGLAMTFEAPGVWDSRHHPSQGDRINRERLAQFRQIGKSIDFAALIADDKLFETQPDLAYASAWALSFYLVEQQPREYAKYLALTAARPEFSDYPAAERTRDFASVFGANATLLRSRFDKFIAGLK